MKQLGRNQNGSTMIEEIRTSLEEISKIDDLITRAEGLDACLSWIKDELEECDLTERDLKVVDNICKSHCREFVSFLSMYGNSGYEEAAPLSELFLNHIQLWVEIDKEDPGFLVSVRPFFDCIE